MALVNPNIAMSYRAPEIQAPNQLAQYAQMQQILGGQQAQELNALKMQEAQAAMQERNALRGLNPADADYFNQLARVNPQIAIQYRKEQTAAEQGKAAAASSTATAQKTNIDNSRSLLVGVNDQPAYDAWRAYSVSKIPELANILPAQFTPQGKDSLLRTAEDISKRLTAAPTTVAAGGSVYDPVTKTFTQAPEKTSVVAPTNLAKLQTELAVLPQGDPRRAQYEAAIRKETQFAPQAVTNITNVQEKAEAGAYGKVLVDQYGDISKSANLAVKTLPSIESNLSILNKGLDTGFGTEAKAAGAKILGALGVPNAEKYATDTQTFQSNALQGVLQKQLEQKGPQTESDAQRIEQIGAQLGKTKAANEFILSTAKEQLRRDIDQRNFYADWRKKTKSFEGAESAWFAGEGGKSLFDRPALKKFAVSGGAAAQIPTTAAPARAPVAPATTAITNPKFPGFSIGKP